MSAEHYLDVYIGGAWTASNGTDRIPVVNPATGATIAEVIAGTAADVDAAARAAREAWPSWAALSPTARAAYLVKIADELERRIDEIAYLESAEVGTHIAMSVAAHAQYPIYVMRETAQLAAGYPWSEPVGTATVVRSPVGVVGQITPWNFPLLQVADKLAPALIAGCTVVLKPSEVAPLTAYTLAEAVHAAGLPAGVFNLVSGVGPVVGEAIATHPEIDMVSFTGSTSAGKRIASLAADSVKRVTLEMGGKSASIILEDADLDAALSETVTRCFSASGQTCVAWSRMLVPRARQDEVLVRVKEIVEKTTVGDPMSNPDIGPLVSEVQRDRVCAYIDLGVEEGARLIAGGPEPPADLPDGFYIQPTVFADVDNSMRIAQEEIFGPVLCVIPYDSEEDAIRIANASNYGLSGAVWTSDVKHGEQIARRLRTGSVFVNGAQHSWGPPPHGGFKHSGVGRESGRFGIDQYVELQTIRSESHV